MKSASNILTVLVVSFSLLSEGFNICLLENYLLSGTTALPGLDSYSNTAIQLGNTAAFLLAVKHINERDCSILEPNCEELLHFPEQRQQDAVVSAHSFEIKEHYPTSGLEFAIAACRNISGSFVIGPATPTREQQLAVLSQYTGIGAIIHSASTANLSQKDSIKSFVRTSVVDTHLAEALARFTVKMGWTKVAVVQQTDTRGSGLADLLFGAVRTLAPKATPLVMFAPLGEQPSNETMGTAVAKIAELDLKILFLIVSDEHVLPFVAELGRVAGGLPSHVVVRATNSAAHTRMVSGEGEAAGTLRGLIGASVRYTHPRFHVFQDRLARYIAEGGFAGDLTQMPLLGPDAPGGGAAAELRRQTSALNSSDVLGRVLSTASTVPQMYDAVLAAAVAASAALRATPNSSEPLGARAIELMRTPGGVPPFSGAARPRWEWDARGEPVGGDFEIVFDGDVRDEASGELRVGVFASWSPGGDIGIDERVVWADGSQYPEIPSDGTDESSDWWKYIAIAAALPAAALLVACVVYLSRRTIRDTRWRIPREEVDIAVDEPANNVAPGTFGTVWKGLYRGTPVVLKPLLPDDIARPNTASDIVQSQAHCLRLCWIACCTRVNPTSVQPAARVGDDIQTMTRLGKGVDPGTPLQHRDPERGHDPESQTTGGVEASAVLVANPNFGQDENKSSSDHGNGSLSRTRSRRRRWSSASISSVSGESDHIGVYDMMAQNKYQSLDENGHMVDAYRFKVSRRYLETDFIKEIQICTNLQHPNILMIYGVMMNGKNRPWLVMEEMEHGSLRDVLFNRSFRFEGEMLLNMLRDIATGMVFLHNCKPPILHRDLKPANVFLDRNMHAKLANFRITLKNRARGYAGTPYWMAPEVLRREGPHTKASDVYSMGILLYEIFTREKPYAGMNPAMVLEKVANRDLDEPFRPELPAELPLDVEALIHDCWAPNPELRPAFEEIRCRVNRLQVKEINKYFEARTARNPADVAKINPRNSMSPDKLYSQLFPQHVAQALRQGHKVDPEVFDCVTVFFCDVVGYTKMSSSMPANEVIDMLERLYTALDDLASKHDIFKVDTIGDAYLAVANLHKPQPDHAARIARFAVDAVAAANTTLVDAHNTKGGCVNIRGGFHSGCVVASVIGTHSPKYTIFGDTVNTASRMESLSEGNRIQCTKESAELIMPYAEEFGVEVVPRGRIDVKGKGTMSTFWVTRASGMETIPSIEDSLL